MVWKKFFLYVLIVFHMIIVLMNLSAFFVLPFFEQWYIALPIMTLIFNISFAKWWKCPLTDLENKIRKDLHMQEIRGFVGHYLIKPMRKIFSANKTSRREEELSGEIVNIAL